MLRCVRFNVSMFAKLEITMFSFWQAPTFEGYLSKPPRDRHTLHWEFSCAYLSSATNGYLMIFAWHLMELPLIAASLSSTSP